MTSGKGLQERDSNFGQPRQGLTWTLTGYFKTWICYDLNCYVVLQAFLLGIVVFLEGEYFSDFLRTLQSSFQDCPIFILNHPQIYHHCFIMGMVHAGWCAILVLRHTVFFLFFFSLIWTTKLNLVWLSLGKKKFKESQTSLILILFHNG